MSQTDGLSRISRRTVLEIELATGQTLEAEADGTAVTLTGAGADGTWAQLMRLDQQVLGALLQLLNEAATENAPARQA
jgi:hypothetical protein